MATRQSYRFLGPEPQDRRQILLEAASAVFPRGAEGLELGLPIADAATEDQLAVGHDVEGTELLRHIERLMQRQQHNAGIKPQARRFGRDPRKKGDLLQILQRMGAVMGALGDRIVAEFLGEPRLREHFPEPIGDRLATRKLSPHHDTELHESLRSPGLRA